jgi:hypothetical protein
VDTKNYRIEEVLAACHAADHTGHPFCVPGWEEDLPAGAQIIRPPVYDGGRWVAIVAVPRVRRARGRRAR